MNWIDEDIIELQTLLDEHPFWDNRLLRACQRGKLTRDDFRFLFGQYAHYSKNFTRYLAGVMLSCQDDYFRSKLSENLWEEGGGADPEERHAELFRRFLVNTLDIPDPRAVPAEDCTAVFVDRYLAGSSNPDHTYGCAFLALGTEGMVARMYTTLVAGMRQAGIEDDQLHFFHLHIGCDDDHAETLWEMLLASRARPDWKAVARRAIDDALTLRASFFEAMYERIERRRLDSLVDVARARQPSEQPLQPVRVYRADNLGEPMYSNQNARLNIDFEVRRMSFTNREVFDVRTVTVAPHANTERHRHAHESVFQIISGSGEVVLGDDVIRVGAGDVLFVPRWVFHQTRNTSSAPLIMLALTDFGFTSAVLGDYDRRTRLKAGGEDADSSVPASSDAVSPQPLKVLA